MTHPATTSIIPPPTGPSLKEPSDLLSGWIDWIQQRDRLWLLLILLILAALMLGGCHARTDGCHRHTHSGSTAVDSVLAAYYVAYFLGWIIVTCASG